MDEIAQVRDALDQLEASHDLHPEHVALFAIARAALARWEQVKRELDAMSSFESAGRYEGSTKVTPLLNVEVKLRSATLSALTTIAKLLEA